MPVCRNQRVWSLTYQFLNENDTFSSEFDEKYSMTEYVLGFDTFSIIRVCVERQTGTRRAAKIVMRQSLISEAEDIEPKLKTACITLDEIDIMMRLEHPNINRLWDLYETDEAVILVMDFYLGGELLDNILRFSTYKEDDIQCIMRQLLSGLQYLHNNGIVHMNLRPVNILMYDQKDTNKRVAISDFCLTHIMPEEEFLLTASGSPQYFAPEVLMGQGYDESVDVWSCGVIAYTLLCGYTPFDCDNMQAMLQNIVNVEYEFHKQHWILQSPLAKDFIRQCVCSKHTRMTVHDALQHPWITQVLKSPKGEVLELTRFMPKKSLPCQSKTELLKSQLHGLVALQRLRKQNQTVTDREILKLDKFVEDFKARVEKGDDSLPMEDTCSETWCVNEPLDKKACKKDESVSGQSSNYTRHYIRESSAQPQQVSQSSDTIQVLNKLLEQYRTAKLPAYSRVDPKAELQPKEEMTFGKAIRSVPAILNRGYSFGSALISHLVYGPPKKSWGVEMSILTRMIREFAEENTDLASIQGLQQFFELVRFLPIPEDGLITPVTFRVKRRNLRGFLAEYDEQETGKRELTGEWIVGKQTWRRLQSEWQNGNRSRSERVIFYVHGGAYFIMSATTHRPLTVAISKYCECRVFCVNYRLAPETIFPGALQDVVYSYLRLTDDLHIPANNIVLAADSAGAGLGVALLMYLRDNNYPLPSGAMLMSPWVDLTLSCDSWETNKEFDYLPRPWRGNHMNPINAYLGPNMDKYLMHPYVSPLFGEMKGLPPMLVQSGDAERLRDEGVLFCHKCSLAGVPVRHEIYEDCVHVFQFFLFLDASRKAFQSMRHFMRKVLDKRKKRKAFVVTEDVREQLDQEMTGTGSEEPVEPGSPSNHQRPAEEGRAGGILQQTLEGLGPEGDEDMETWELDNDEEEEEGQARHRT